MTDMEMNQLLFLHISLTFAVGRCVKTKIAYHFVILSMAKNLNTSIMCLQILHFRMTMSDKI